MLIFSLWYKLRVLDKIKSTYCVECVKIMQYKRNTY